MSDKQQGAPERERRILNPTEDVLGGGIRGEVAGCPTGAAEADLEPDGNAQDRRPTYGAAGGEDSSPFEDVPSGQKEAAAEAPQNADPDEKR
jgi:hypothetical protein